MEKEYLNSSDFAYLREIDIRVLKNKNLSSDEKVLLLRYYAEDIVTIYEDLETTATWVNMTIKKTQKIRDGLVRKGYLQELNEQICRRDGVFSVVKAYRPIFSKIRNEQ